MRLLEWLRFDWLRELIASSKVDGPILDEWDNGLTRYRLRLLTDFGGSDLVLRFESRHFLPLPRTKEVVFRLDEAAQRHLGGALTN